MPKPNSNPGALAGEQLISLQSPFGGWVTPLSSVSATPHYQASIEGVEAPTFAKQNSNQYAESSGVTLFQFEKFGQIAPGNGYSVTTDSSTFINDLPLNGVVESTNQFAVIVLGNGRLVQLATGGASTVAKYDPTASTTRTGIAGSRNNDMVIFRDLANTSIEYVVWTYDYSDGGGNHSDIAIIKSSNISSSSNDAWYSGLSPSGAQALVYGVPHKITVGPDGNLYVTNGAYVQQIVITGAIGSATIGNTMPAGTGWTAQGICNYKNYTATIISNKVSNFSYGLVRVLLWDGLTSTIGSVTSTAPEYIYDIPDNFGNGVHFDGQILRAFTNGRNTSSKIFELTSKGFEKVFETPFINSSINPNQGGIDNFQDGIIIAAMKGDNLGHLFRQYSGGFHDEGYFSDGDNTSGHIASDVGLIKNFFSNNFFVGIKTGTSYKIYYRNPNTYQTSTALSNTIDMRTIMYDAGILGRREYPMGYKMSLSRIKLFFGQWGTGASLYISLFRGYDTCLPGNNVPANGGVDQLNILIDTNATLGNGFQTIVPGSNPGGYSTGYVHYYNAVGSLEVDMSDIVVTDLSSFYMNIRWTHTTPSASAAIIRRMELHVAQ